MARILAKTEGGPLDGLYFSVVEEQETIEGMNHMPESSRYAKRSDSTRNLENEEAGLVKHLFDTEAHDLKQIAFFDYEEGTSENPA